MTRFITLIFGIVLSVQIFGQPITVVDGSAFGQRIASMSADAENALNNLEQLLEQADKMKSQVARMDSIKSKVTKVSNRIKMLARFTDLLQNSKNAVLLLKYGTETITKSKHLTPSDKIALAQYMAKAVDNIIEDVKQIKELIEHPEKSEMSEHERYNEITAYEVQVSQTIRNINSIIYNVKQLEVDYQTKCMRKDAFTTYGIYDSKSQQPTTKKTTRKINW